MKKQLPLFLVFISLYLPTCLPAQEKPEEYKNPFVKAIHGMNYRSFPPDFSSWSAWSSYEHLQILERRSLFPSRYSASRRAFQLFEKYKELLPTQMGDVVNRTTLEDLQFYCGGEDKENYLIEHIDRTHTALGRVMLYLKTAHPHNNQAIEKVVSFQNAQRALLENENLAEKLNHELCMLRRPLFVLTKCAVDAHLIRFCEGSNIKASGLSFLNRSALSHQMMQLIRKVYTTLGIVTTVGGSILLPWYAYKKFFGKDLGKWECRTADQQKSSLNPLLNLAYMLPGIDLRAKVAEHPKVDGLIALGTGLFAALFIPHVMCNARDTLVHDKLMQKILNEIAACFRGMRNVVQLIKEHPELQKHLPSTRALSDLFDELPKKEAQLRTLQSKISSRHFNRGATYDSLSGPIYSTFYLFQEIKDLLKPALFALAELDVVNSCVRLIKEHEDKPVNYSFVEFLDEDVPRIEFDNLFNPFISPDVVVPNDIQLGGDVKNNMVITGPNAGGKSTVMKAVATSLILAQSLGIAPASRAVVTPFSRIHTYMSVVDDIGAGNSLFKSEVLSAQKLIEDVAALKVKQFSFSAIDEMFSGTSPVEGAAAAYSVAKHLAGYPRSINMLATHFELMTKLEGQTETFANYKVSVHVGEDGSIHYPFTLTPGISEQNVAIDILKDEGFDSSILQDAEQIIAQSLG